MACNKDKKKKSDEASMTHGGMGYDSKNFLGKSDTSKMKDIGYEEENEEEIKQMMENALQFSKTIRKNLK